MKKHLISTIFIIMTIVVWAVCYQALPYKLPVHWGLSGNPDRFETKFGALFIFVGITLAVYIMMSLLPRMDKKNNVALFKNAYDKIFSAIMGFIFAINLLVISYGLGASVPVDKIMQLLLGLLFVITGNFLSQLRKNHFVGIRTPWTLNSEYVWKKTHRIGSFAFVFVGLFNMIAIFLPYGFFISLAMLLAVVVGTCIYSYILYKKENSNILD